MQQGILIPALLSFLLGSIPFGLLVSRIFRGTDVRKEGSGNVGATNVSRVMGFFPAGLLTLLLDVAKGALPLFVLYNPRTSSWISVLSGTPTLTDSQLWMVGFAAVAGHCFSPWLQFRGGKGVATAFGVIAVMSPISALVGVVTFISIFQETRTGSLASLSAALLCLTSLAVLSHNGEQLFPAAALLFLVLLRHESNLDALLEGREHVFR
ncbi:MAG: acyl-phosphate glycerol 3-phosphate acyltransferase [Bdellovibrionales bacterium GWB1_55_8]|nr:MAG: acyl-phosphate glycerol 3-phosphate acyltransferase [Bdellovibrionales bacterium GWB1_55_8]